MSVEVMRTVIDAAEGRVPVDTLFANAADASTCMASVWRPVALPSRTV
ncbi:MAG: hypothetical protein ACLTHL_05685 [Collinsella sp.]